MSRSRSTVLITGGSGGIGSAVGRLFTERGDDVVLTSRSPEPLQAAADEIGAEAVPADASSESSFSVAASARDRWDLVVHCGGLLAGGTVMDEPTEILDDLYRSHLRATHVVARATIPRMVPGSRLVLLGSTAGLRGMASRASYSALKAGMQGFAEALAQEVEELGIGVHVVAPGPVNTPMLLNSRHALEPSDVAQGIAFLHDLRPGVNVPLFEMSIVMSGPLAPETVGPGSVTARAAGGST